MSKTELTTKQFFAQDKVKEKFEDLLGKKSTNYITTVLQVVSNNNLLRKADPQSIFNAAAMAAVLDLPVEPNLQMAHIIPYNQSIKTENGWVKKTVAQFQIGYRGFIQLAIRSSEYITLNATPVYKNQLLEYNPLEGHKFDWSQPRLGEPIGYASFYELKNGFTKTIYLTSEECQEHGRRFSKNYEKNTSTWKTDFIGMALKTVIKQLIDKWGPKSLEMQQAIQADQAVINNYENSDFTYADNPRTAESETINAEFEDITNNKEENDDDLI